MAAIYHDLPDGSLKHSLRTRHDDIDVSALAPMLGSVDAE